MYPNEYGIKRLPLVYVDEIGVVVDQTPHACNCCSGSLLRNLRPIKAKAGHTTQRLARERIKLGYLS